MAKKKPAVHGEPIPHVMRQVILAAEFRMRMYKPQDWTEDPETLLSDLRVLMNWRSEVITDNAFTKVNKYAYTVHRDNSISLGQLFAITQDVLSELRAITPMSSLPVDPRAIACRSRVLVQSLHESHPRQGGQMVLPGIDEGVVRWRRTCCVRSTNILQM